MSFSVWALSRVLACLAGGIVIQREKVLAAFPPKPSYAPKTIQQTMQANRVPIFVSLILY